MKTVDVIIPVYKPDEKFKKLIYRLSRQTYAVNKIIVFNTEEKYFDEFFYGTGFLEKYRNLEIHHISRYEFDHGRTRKTAVTYSDADIFLCMTDDAVPLDDMLIENLVSPIIDGEAKVTYARQCADKSAPAIERYTRKFNYPGVSRLKTIDDRDELGIKLYFCSNVCAAYDRKTYDELGGFIDRTIFNEDMIFASRVINAGYAIKYVADARVNHCHVFTNMQQLHRNFDLGVSQAQHPEVFADMPSTGEGMKLVKDTTRYLIRKHKFFQIPRLYINSGFKFAGFILGKRYKKLPRFLIMKLTMNPVYWDKE